MKWERLLAEIQYLALHHAPPKAIIIHVGSNDLCDVKCNVMRQVMRKDLLELHSLLPNVKLLTSAMLPRLSWPAFFPLDKAEKKGKHLNRFLRRITNFLGGDFITHDEINAETPGFYFRDGIHLSDVGCDMFLLAIKESIENILS